MKETYCTDACVFIESWRTIHPYKTFPSLWKKIAEHRNRITLIQPIYDEIKEIFRGEKSAVKKWLIEQGFEATPIDDKVRETSLQLQKEYETSPNPNTGASKNDITLIAYAKPPSSDEKLLFSEEPKEISKIIVTLEGKQEQDPSRKKYNYKIPLICEEKGIKCINFVEMLEELHIEHLVNTSC